MLLIFGLKFVLLSKRSILLLALIHALNFLGYFFVLVRLKFIALSQGPHRRRRSPLPRNRLLAFLTYVLLDELIDKLRSLVPRDRSCRLLWIRYYLFAHKKTLPRRNFRWTLQLDPGLVSISQRKPLVVCWLTLIDRAVVQIAIRNRITNILERITSIHGQTARRFWVDIRRIVFAIQSLDIGDWIVNGYLIVFWEVLVLVDHLISVLKMFMILFISFIWHVRLRWFKKWWLFVNFVLLVILLVLRNLCNRSLLTQFARLPVCVLRLNQIHVARQRLLVHQRKLIASNCWALFILGYFVHLLLQLRCRPFGLDRVAGDRAFPSIMLLGNRIDLISPFLRLARVVQLLTNLLVVNRFDAFCWRSQLLHYLILLLLIVNSNRVFFDLLDLRLQKVILDSSRRLFGALFHD